VGSPLSPEVSTYRKKSEGGGKEQPDMKKETQMDDNVLDRGRVMVWKFASRAGEKGKNEREKIDSLQCLQKLRGKDILESGEEILGRRGCHGIERRSTEEHTTGGELYI